LVLKQQALSCVRCR